MAQGLHLSQRMTQSLVLSPQMQQSLALLQAPTLELKALVEQELQQNPLLEEVPTAEVELNEKIKNDEADDGAIAAAVEGMSPHHIAQRQPAMRLSGLEAFELA